VVLAVRTLLGGDEQIVLDRVLGEDCRSSGTNPMPARAIACGFLPCIGSPSTQTRPLAGGAIPAIAFSVVDLPAPLRPSRAMVWPAVTAMLTPNRIWLVP
jgi:hypothetical protein